MNNEYLNNKMDSKNTLQVQIKHLENELQVTKAENEKTIQKYLELYSNVEEKVKERSIQLKKVQQRLEVKTKQLEQDRKTLINTEQRFKDLFQNSPEAIVVIDLKHRIIGINPAACLMFNKSKRDLIGDVPYFNALAHEKEEMIETYNQICQSKQSFTESTIWTADQVAIPIEISSSRMQYLGQQSIVLHIHDISNSIESEKKIREAMDTINEYNQKLEQMLEDRTKDLIRTERHAAFSLLIQGIVHNLRNPLTVVSSGAELILLNKEKLENDNVTIPEELKSALESSWHNSALIIKSSKKLVKIINSMMAKSKSDNTDEIETVDINEIVNQELEFLDTDSQFKSRLRKSIYLANDKLMVEIVPSEVSQVFQNLVRNAMDALYSTVDAMIEIYTGRSDDKVWFSIQDNGPGIPKDIQSKIFDPFFSTKPKATTKKSEEPVGTGLGLYICSEMVHAYDGKIELKSKENVGTKVTVYIPASKAK
jgi:PAS domain S-box-containing protein